MTTSDNEVLRAVCEFEFADASIAQMVYWFLTDFTSDQSDNDVANQCEQYIEDILDQVKGIIHSSLSLNQSEVNQMTWDSVTESWKTARLVGLITPIITFTGTGDALPRTVAALMTANTDRPKTRGRKFFPGWNEAANVDGVIQSSQLTALGLALAQYLADETISAGNDLLVGVASTVDGTFHQFTDGVAQEIMSSQRRRKQGVGA